MESSLDDPRVQSGGRASVRETEVFSPLWIKRLLARLPVSERGNLESTLRLLMTKKRVRARVNPSLRMLPLRPKS